MLVSVVQIKNIPDTWILLATVTTVPQCFIHIFKPKLNNKLWRRHCDVVKLWSKESCVISMVTAQMVGLYASIVAIIALMSV